MLRYRAADGATLAYRDQGPTGGIPLVLVHGWQSNGSVWSPLASVLAEKHRVISVDLRGTGASSAPGPYEVGTFASDLADLIDAIDLDPIVLVGHSMGGTVALRFAIDHPDAIEGLVLLSPVPASGLAFPPKVEAFFRATAGDAAVTAKWLAGLTLHEPPPQIVKLLRDAAATVPAEVALESFESWTRADFADETATIATPTLVVAPSDDRALPPAFLREKVVDVIPSSRLEVVAACGHYAGLEQVERIAGLIDAFVEAL